MCGILAGISFGAPFSSSEVFDLALEAIAHRGPDAGGKAYFKNGNPSNRQSFDLFLGHKRLAILDLDPRSNQPFEEEELTLIFNGEIFNYLELKTDLQNKGHQFRSNSDTEVILKAYREYGENFVKYFNGMWSLILLDQKNQNLYLSRDRFGIKPLYYFKKNNQVFYASEIKQLKYFTNQITPNISVLSNFVRNGDVDSSNRTFFNEFQQFPPAHLMKINLRNGEQSLKRFWDFSLRKNGINSMNENDAILEFRSLLLDSLRLRLRTDVPFGTLLSGGLDSSAISSLIQRYLMPEIETFSMVSNSKKYSEHHYIDLLSKENKIKNHSFNFAITEATQHVDEVLNIQDEPFGSFSVVAQNGLFKKIKNETEIKVLLSGQGADEVLMGYLKFYFLNLKTKVKKGEFKSFIQLFMGAIYHGTIFKQFSLAQAKRYLPGSSTYFQNYFTGPIEVLNLPYSSMNERQILDIENYSIPALTRYEDRNSMNHSLEVRLPFLDYRLVDFLVSLSPDLMMKNGWSKYLLRQSIDELPHEIRWRKDKLGFTTPEAEWWKGEFGKSFYSDYTHSILQELGIIDLKKFKKSFMDFRNSKGFMSEGDIFRVFIAEKWLKQF